MRTMRRVVLAALAAALIDWLPGLAAAEKPGCDAFKWPLASERAAFESPKLEAVESGAARGPLKEQAFALKLAPEASVVFAVAPGGKSHAEGRLYAGTVSFDAPEKPGSYQVTLANEGWIDVVQGGASLQSTDHTGAKDCPGLRKSVRFSIGASPLVLQVSGVPVDTIKVAIRPAE
jgi:hypothetical protein